MSPADIRVLAGLLEVFAANDAEHCGGTEHRIQSANVMRALADVAEAAKELGKPLTVANLKDVVSGERRKRLILALSSVEALKP